MAMLLVGFSSNQFSSAFICSSEDFPLELLECLQEMQNKTDIYTTTGSKISLFCINTFLMKHGSNREKLTEENKQFINDLIQNPPYQISTDANGRRTRSTRLRKRKEYRDLTDEERYQFHAALNMMKYDKATEPNVYDTIAKLHSDQGNSAVVHKSPNFLGWHRIYLFIFENALLRQIPTVIFPYWDCTFDAHLIQDKKIHESHLFSEDFVGNADGRVETGPFKDWNLKRNLGKFGDLMSKNNISNILSCHHHREIVAPTCDSYRYFLEGFHNDIHNYIGGYVSILTEASRDPMFFLLHNFVDYIWWLFRERLKELGTDPETDYPEVANSSKNDPMEGFPEYKNIDGYGKFWTDHVYTFEMTPQCPRCGDSKWLKCDTAINKCVAKTVSELDEYKRRNQRDTIYQRSQEIEFSREDGAYKANAYNSFEIDGKPNNNWYFLPVDVIYLNSTGVKNISDFPNYNNGTDIYLSILNTSKGYQQTLASRQHCQISPSGFNKVYVMSHGLSYRGVALEHAVVDQRLQITVSRAFVPVKDRSSTFLLTAFDECGKSCHPQCREENGTEFRNCSGVLSFKNICKNCSDTSKTDNENLDGSLPISSEKTSCIRFVCDNIPLYPWERIKTL